MQKQQGMFIVIDGPSGSGKDTLAASLIANLDALGKNPFLLSEDVLDENRQEILEARGKGKNLGGSGDREMADVLVRHRVNIYRKFLNPQLEGGSVVIANRGEPATLAYQTARGELTMDAVWEMHRNAGIPTPDLVVLTNCKAQTALQREEIDMASSSLRSEREAGSSLSGKITREVGATREEQLRRRESIHFQYKETGEFLERRGVSVLSLDTENMTVPEEVKEVKIVLGHISGRRS